jgi:hypothetical protein
MKQSRIFIASSKEGLAVVNTIKDLLIKKLGTQADVRPWTREFELSKTYIESLEKVAKENDFAIMLMTPDDITISREIEKLSPRDNVIFELGLFMGCLGRDRCFIVHDKTRDLKLPTDLLGIMAAKYNSLLNNELAVILEEPVSEIVIRILELGYRVKLTEEIFLKQAEVRSFCDKVEGSWWEYVLREGADAISYFQIESDLLYNSVSLTGKSYDKNGFQVSNWKSLIGRIDPDENKILYHWKGWHTAPELANLPFSGFGEIEFYKPRNVTDIFMRGGGKFWDVDEAHPEKTTIDPIQIHRIEDENIILTMQEGNNNERSIILKKTLDEW